MIEEKTFAATSASQAEADATEWLSRQEGIQVISLAARKNSEDSLADEKKVGWIATVTYRHFNSN
ncbi:MAG: hypothetical protein FD144_155 [Rhodospirillaceae bacterium]|nr:MAG: hypothetical protein FD144_155 [Rhodospirillaceae bacterium]